MVVADFLRSTYQDLLEMLGLSNFQFTLLALALISLLALLIMLKRMGVILTPLRVKRVVWPQCILLYRQYQGEYNRIGPQFDLVRKDTQATFPRAVMFGHYYDNPTMMADPSNCRAVLGLVLRTPQHQQQAEQFVAKHVDYELRKLESSEVYQAPFPFYNQISFMLLPMLAYPRLKRFLEGKGELDVMRHGVMEFYDLAESRINLVVPLTSPEQFQLSKYPTEDKKEQ